MSKPNEQIIEEVSSVRSRIKQIDSSTQTIAKLLSSDEEKTILINKEIGKVNKSCKSIINTMYAVSNFTYTFNRNVYGNPGLVEDVKIEWIGDRLHVVFPTLLPARSANTGGRINVYGNRDKEAMYLPAFDDFFSKKENKRRYDCKVVLMYTHFHLKKDHWKDVDNIETNFITNLVASYLLKDDSPVYCSLYVDSRQGKTRHTELDVVPYIDFPKLLAVR